MSMYLFYPCLEDGSPTSFEAYELRDDDAAREQAERVLASHASAARVTVWRDGEAVHAVGRGPPSRSDGAEGPSLGEG